MMPIVQSPRGQSTGVVVIGYENQLGYSLRKFFHYFILKTSFLRSGFIRVHP
jgi:hypothetical protein